MRVALVGGTGPAGIGLAARLARAGHEVAVGSRSAERAEDAADRVRGLLAETEHSPGGNGALTGSVAAGPNEDVVREADVVVLTVPPDVHIGTAKALAGTLEGKVVVSIANPITVEKPVVRFEPPPEGSLAEGAQKAAPGARVVGAFHEMDVRRFPKLERALEGDTIVTGDDEEAKEAVMRLARDIGVRPVDGGGLENARHVEAFVAVLIAINIRYKASTSLRVMGLP